MNQVIRTLSSRSLFFTLFILSWGCVSCSTSEVETIDRKFEKSVNPLAFERSWKEEFPGPITELRLAVQTGDVLAASIPNPETGGRHFLTLLSSKGKTVFQVPLDFPVKNLDISADGSWMVVLNHEGQLFSIDRSGKKLWEVEASCRPIILNELKKILCYHDDDTVTSDAFEIFSSEGKSEKHYPVKSDVLALKLSADQKWIALGLAGGKLQLISTQDFSTASQVSVKGEILDVAVSNGEAPRYGAITIDAKTGQNVALFELDDRPRGLLHPPYHIEQIELLPSGKKVAVYGNSPKGQYIATVSGEDLSVLWEKLEPRYADYSLSIQVGEDLIIAGFEAVGKKSRESEILVLDLDGKLRSKITLNTVEGSYLYSFNYSALNSVLAIASDDQTLQIFKTQ